MSTYIETAKNTQIAYFHNLISFVKYQKGKELNVTNFKEISLVKIFEDLSEIQS